MPEINSCSYPVSLLSISQLCGKFPLSYFQQTLTIYTTIAKENSNHNNKGKKGVFVQNERMQSPAIFFIRERKDYIIVQNEI
jgi:hypothetical protein